MNTIIDLSEYEYKLIKNLVYNRFGINLGDKKKALVSGRLNKILKQLGISSFKEYYKYIVDDRSGDALNTLINRISTNHTFFFRESAHYTYLKKMELSRICNVLRSKNQNKIRIWSAACSSGEEVYSLAMVIDDYLSEYEKDFDFKILGTDISSEVLELAKTGIYTQEKAKTVPVNYKYKYFKHLDDGRSEIIDHLKQKIMFRRLNLMNETYPFKNEFHIVFCRNVMIYFDSQTRYNLVNKINTHMANKSKLFIGLAESINRKNLNFHYLEPGIYENIN